MFYIYFPRCYLFPWTLLASTILSFVSNFTINLYYTKENLRPWWQLYKIRKRDQSQQEFVQVISKQVFKKIASPDYASLRE
jgi:hypothetical protein